MEKEGHAGVGLAVRLLENESRGMWLAGVRTGGEVGSAGFAREDEAVEGRVSTNDWHATILHILGLDHEQLTFNHAGRDYRLTDVSGQVIQEILS